jgi:chromosome segregation ATPase
LSHLHFELSMRSVRYLASALLLLVVQTGCYLQRDGEALETRFTILEAKQADLSSTLETERNRLAVLIKEAESKVAAIQTMLGEAEASLRRNNADLGVRMDATDKESALLRGRLEETLHQIENLKQELQLTREDLAAQIAQLAGH